MHMSRRRLLLLTRPRVVRVLERIAADLDNLSLVPNDPHRGKESIHAPRAYHCHELAELSREPKKLSHQEQRTALRLRAALGLLPRKADRVFRNLNAFSAVLGSAATRSPNPPFP
jgi:hypothetical protein